MPGILTLVEHDLQLKTRLPVTKQAGTNPVTSSSAGTPITQANRVVAAGTDRMLLVAIHLEVATDTVSTVTKGGVALKRAARMATGSFAVVEFWYLLNPAVATDDLVVTLGVNTHCVVASYVFDNVDQAEPFFPLVFQTGNTTSSSLTVSGELGDGALVVDALDIDGTGHLNTAGADQTEEYDIEVAAGTTTGVGSTQSGANRGVMSHSWTTSGPFAHLATALRASISAAVTMTQPAALSTFSGISAAQASASQPVGNASFSAVQTAAPTATALGTVTYSGLASALIAGTSVGNVSFSAVQAAGPSATSRGTVTYSGLASALVAGTSVGTVTFSALSSGQAAATAFGNVNFSAPQQSFALGEISAVGTANFSAVSLSLLSAQAPPANSSFSALQSAAPSASGVGTATFSAGASASDTSTSVATTSFSAISRAQLQGGDKGTATFSSVATGGPSASARGTATFSGISSGAVVSTQPSAHVQYSAESALSGFLFVQPAATTTFSSVASASYLAQSVATVTFGMTRTNLWVNGGVESTLTGLTAGYGTGGTLTRDNTDSRFGNWSAKFIAAPTGTGGVGTAFFGIKPDTRYTASFYIKGVAGTQYNIRVLQRAQANGGGATTNDSSGPILTADGTWQRVTLSAISNPATGGVSFGVISRTVSATFFLDGFQFEVGADATEYIETDGSPVTVFEGAGGSAQLAAPSPAGRVDFSGSSDFTSTLSGVATATFQASSRAQENAQTSPGTVVFSALSELLVLFPIEHVTAVFTERGVGTISRSSAEASIVRKDQGAVVTEGKPTATIKRGP